jgi:hypothetical protein
LAMTESSRDGPIEFSKHGWTCSYLMETVD